MIKIDLITGFLGSGKTTFLKKYASYLISRGLNVGILENDFGAVNVDMMLLQNLRGEHCELEMVSGGCDRDCHRRRFKTKLISMAMSGYDRVLVEPSGVFDVDEFFDALYEEPLDKWYEIGSVIAIADASSEEKLTEASEYYLAEEISSAGIVLLSRVQEGPSCSVNNAREYLNCVLENVRSSRRLGNENILACDWEKLSDKDFDRIMNSGYVSSDYEKKTFDDDKFQSKYFMNSALSLGETKEAVCACLEDPLCGQIFRIKGFVREKGKWYELNAARKKIHIEQMQEGQSVLIVIGENLNGSRIEEYFGMQEMKNDEKH